MKRLNLTSNKFNAARKNSNPKTKVQLRRNLVKILGLDNPKILDVFCGGGEMWRLSYNKSKNYIGLDKTHYSDERETVCCENDRFLRNKYLDLNEFDIFDIDAYGSGCYQLAIICKRLAPLSKPKIVCLTDGCGYSAKMNSTPPALLNYLGLPKIKQSKFEHKNRERILDLFLRKTANECSATIEHLSVFKADGSNEMLYLGYILTPKS